MLFRTMNSLTNKKVLRARIVSLFSISMVLTYLAAPRHEKITIKKILVKEAKKLSCHTCYIDVVHLILPFCVKNY